MKVHNLSFSMVLLHIVEFRTSDHILAEVLSYSSLVEVLSVVSLLEVPSSGCHLFEVLFDGSLC